MLALSPREQYRNVHQADLEDYRKLVRSRLFTIAGVYTMADLAQAGLSQEQLQGARAFLTAMLNLGEPPETPKPLPAKELKNG